MGMTAADYLAQLQALLPPGAAWTRDSEAALTKLMQAIADEFARVDGRSAQLLEEADPRTTSELLADWERVAGLPDACSAGQTMQLGAGYHSIADNLIADFSRASSATYIDNGLLKYASINELRRKNGLLFIEKEATNLLTYSEQFENAAWAKNSLLVSSNAIAAPDGSLTADKVYEDATNSYHRLVSNITGSSGYARRFSIYVKAAGRDKARGWSYSGGNTSQQTFDLASGTCTGTLNPTIESVGGGGWYRCSFDVPNPHSYVVFGPSNGAINTNAYVGDGVSGIYVWGAQLEVDTSATSYIPTTSATVSRAADICGILVQTTTAQRRAALHTRLTTLGSQSAAYFIVLAESMGYTVTITEFHLHTVEDDVDYPLYAAPWQFAWQVNAPQDTIGVFSVADTVDDPLAWWGNEILECVISRLKPAHTHVLFAYS